MGRGRTLARVLSGGALLLLIGADRPALPIREALWLDPSSLPGTLLRQPTECLAWPRDPDRRRSVAIGRAAFGAPLLLGGQAARAGLSCATCHRNGRGNPHFRFPGLSGVPGTADVTSSLMSKKRGDGAFNPRPIPDLSGPSSGLKQVGGGESRLRRFVRGLVVEEFDGHEPPPEVLEGLVAYVRALSPAACPVPAEEPITLSRMLAQAAAAVRAAQTAADPDGARLLIGAARSELGQIDQRFGLPGLDVPRERLRRSDLLLRSAQEARGATRAHLLQGWLRSVRDLEAHLRRYDHRSLFNPAVLKRELSRGSAGASG